MASCRRDTNKNILRVRRPRLHLFQASSISIGFRQSALRTRGSTLRFATAKQLRSVTNNNHVAIVKTARARNRPRCNLHAKWRSRTKPVSLRENLCRRTQSSRHVNSRYGRTLLVMDNCFCEVRRRRTFQPELTFSLKMLAPFIFQ